MTDELAEAAFLAGVPSWTDACAKKLRDKKPEEAKEIALRLGRGYLLLAAGIEERLAHKEAA